MEILEKMFDDTLWIYTAIVGALLSAAFLAWFRNTRAGLWCYTLFDRILDGITQRYGWTWFQEPDDVWRKRYPKITQKIDELEARINKLEGNNDNRHSIR